MHQETGRNIYIGALHYDEQIPRPDDIVAAAGPKAMEYRVVARRTSIRSLMGKVLLQGELATGKPPGRSTTEFAGDIMAAVHGSLYAGDSLQIRVNKDNSTVASLGGLELARTDARDVSDYFLKGWVGEGGPSTAFRSSILATDIDSSLMPIYNAHTTSTERLAAISSWGEPVETEAAPKVPPTSVAVVAAIAAQQLADSTPTLSSPATQIFLSSNSYPGGIGLATAAEPVLLASLTPSQQMILPETEVKTAAEITIEAIDAMEYSQRLASFNTLVLRKIYSHIRYPNVAVRRNIQGTLELDLVMDDKGGLLDITVARSSGHSILDKSALRAARNAFSGTSLDDIDQVAVAEYSEDGSKLVIPIPISFVLTE
jgi:TonB family protein